MRKQKKFLQWGSLLIVMGFLMIMAGFLLGGKDYVAQADLNNLNWNQQTAIPGEVNVEKEPLADFTTIDIQFTRADIAIVPSTNEQAFLSYHIVNPNNGGEINYQVANSKLTIHQGTTKKNFVSIDLSFIQYLFNSDVIKAGQETKLTLYLPQKTYDQVAVDNELGAITIQNLTAKEVDFQSSTGAIDITNSQFEVFNSQNSLGKLSVSQSQWQEGKLVTDTGLIALEAVTARNSQIQSDLGAINLVDSSFEDSTFKTDTGHIQSQTTDFTGETKVTTDLGRLSFEFTEERLATTNFTIKSDLGEITTPPQLETKDKNRPDSFDVKSDTGSITIQ